MKTTLTRTLTALKRAGLMFQIRCLETTLQGQHDALMRTDCRHTREEIIAAMASTTVSLKRVRRDYLAIRDPRTANFNAWRAA